MENLKLKLENLLSKIPINMRVALISQVGMYFIHFVLTPILFGNTQDNMFNLRLTTILFTFFIICVFNCKLLDLIICFPLYIFLTLLYHPKYDLGDFMFSTIGLHGTIGSTAKSLSFDFILIFFIAIQVLLIQMIVSFFVWLIKRNTDRE